jgi:hypothetical protein
MDSNYLFQPKDDTVGAYIDLMLRCLVCDKKLEIRDPEIKEIEVGYYRLTGYLIGGERITFDDGNEAYLCYNCITGEKQ